VKFKVSFIVEEAELDSSGEEECKEDLHDAIQDELSFTVEDIKIETLEPGD
jgi:hypothetical protein